MDMGRFVEIATWKELPGDGVRDGHTIALIGHPEHIEMQGIHGHAAEHTVVVDPDDPDPDIALLPAARPVAWLSQTTLAVEDVAALVSVLRQQFPNLVDPPKDDICYASTNRQSAVKAIAPRCDLVLVVGSASSSNSRRLVEVARTAGALDARLIDSAAELRTAWLAGTSTIGVTAGASRPDILVDDLLDALAAHGFTTVKQVARAD